VLAVEKRQTSPLLEQTSLEKVFEVDRHIGVAVSGLVADARTLVDHARVECQNHRFTYDEPLRVESLTQSVCDLKMQFGEGGEDDENGEEEGKKKAKMSRPFGVALLIAGVDARGPTLFHTDPSGTFMRYEAHAIGAGAEGAVTMLQDKYNKSMSLAAAQALAVRVLGDTMEEKLTAGNFELATVTPGRGFVVHPTAELVPLVERALAEAAAEGGV
jgi:20S proteasome subunit alpha 5